MNAPSRNIGLIGLGLIFVWGSAFIPWLDFWKSSYLASQLIGILGICAVSVTITATFLYINFLENEVKRLKNHAEA